MMRKTLLGFVVSIFASGASGTAFAQSGGAAPPPAAKKEPTAAAPADAPKMDPKAMEAMQKYATPGEEHQKLKTLVGTWDAAVSMQEDPKSPAMTMQGKAEFKMALGDRYLEQEFTGNFGGMPFTGRGLLGYNTVLKKYQSVWVDSMSTGVMSGEGAAGKDGAITMVSTSTDPVKGKVQKGKDVWRIEGDKKITFEMWLPPAKGGKEFKMMEIVYTKK